MARRRRAHLYHVGYDAAAHVNHADKRRFGAPPIRDVERLRGILTESAGL
jgi:hypothetical protein